MCRIVTKVREAMPNSNFIKRLYCFVIDSYTCNKHMGYKPISYNFCVGLRLSCKRAVWHACASPSGF